MSRSRPHTQPVVRLVAARRRVRGAGEQGFTLVELLAALAILGIAMGLLSGLIIGISEQTSADQYSVQALSQTQLAGETLVQYLRGATEILPASPSPAGSPVAANTSTGPTDLTIVASEGYNDSTYTSYQTTVCAQWLIPSSGQVDAVFDVTFDCGTSTQRTVASYYALAGQTQAVFTYYEYSTTTGLLTPLPVQNPVPACAIGEIVAVGIHVTFASGPQRAVGGYAGDEATSLDTTVYLRGDGLVGTGGSTTTTTSTTTACAN
jgi:prepilin-type N-terminal cleavage/methylation domain-containing protein